MSGEEGFRFISYVEKVMRMTHALVFRIPESVPIPYILNACQHENNNRNKVSLLIWFSNPSGQSDPRKAALPDGRFLYKKTMCLTGLR